MSQDEHDHIQDNLPSLWSAIIEVIKGLRKQPLFLLAFGLAILIMAVATVALENLRVIAVSFIIMLIVALAFWLIYESMKLRKSHQGSGNKVKIRGGEAAISDGAIVDQADVYGGNVRLSEFPAGEQEISGGDAVVGKAAKIEKSKVKGGDVKIGN